jgi:hypothetical protein
MGTKRLIYHFYLCNDYCDNVANKVHFECLKYYASVFDEIVIVFACDDNLDYGIKEKASKYFLDILGCNGRITFKYMPNGIMRDAQTFYDEIATKMDILDGITFFGHNKGYTNVTDSSINVQSVLEWIIGMYFMSLNDIDDVSKRLMSDGEPRFYGSYLMVNDKIPNKYHAYYTGTFFWIHTMKVYEIVKYREGMKIPALFHRGYAEVFPGNICKREENTEELCESVNGYLFDVDMYHESYAATEFLLSQKPGLLEKYNKLKDEILSKI